MVVGLSGIAGVLVASAGWGSNYVVVKKYDMGDGLLFQLWMCTGLLCVGIATLFVAPPAAGYVPGEEGNAGELRPRLPLLCVGSGALWCIGNLVTVEIVRTIGLGLGIALWSGSSLLLAFVLGRFATCFGDECLVVMPLQYGALAVIGLLLSVLSLALFACVKPTTAGYAQTETEQIKPVDSATSLAELQNGARTTPSPERQRGATSPLGSAPQPESAEPLSAEPASAPAEGEGEAGDGVEAPGVLAAQLRGLVLALFAGFMYGIRFLPCSIYGQHHVTSSPLLMRQMRVMFAQYVGSFITGGAAYAVYCAHRWRTGRTPARIDQEAMMPSVLSGALWATGTIGAMVAISQLGYGVGYALCSNGCFLVAGGWSVGYYAEVQGRRNLTLFGLAALLNALGSVLLIAAPGAPEETVPPAPPAWPSWHVIDSSAAPPVPPVRLL